MSTNIPPNPNVDTFNTLYWKTGNGQLTIEEADLRYLKWPIAQGTENLQTTNVNGLLTANAGIKTNIIEAATGTTIDIGKSRLLGQMNCNSNVFINFRGFTGNGIQPVQFNSIGQTLELIGDVDMLNAYSLTNVVTLNNDSPIGLTIENLQDTDIILKTDTTTRLTIGTTINAYSNVYMNNLSIYDTIRLQNNSAVNNLLIQSNITPIILEYGGLSKLTISNDIAFGGNLNCQNNGIYNTQYIDGISNTDLNISAIGTGDLQLFTGGSGVTNRLTFRDTGICLANSNGLFIQGTTVATAQVKLGYNAGLTQLAESIAIGGGSGANQSFQCIAIGSGAAGVSQGLGAVAIGLQAGETQSTGAIGIGYRAGRGTTLAQGEGAIAMGSSAGLSSQRRECIAIGVLAGSTNQGLNFTSAFDASIAIGHGAGQTSQVRTAIAIGSRAGNSNQALSAIAIGYSAGQNNQATQSICIGPNAGNSGAGANSIYIGNNCGTTSTLANSIILSAIGTAFNPTVNQGFYVNPVRMTGTASAFLMYYNPTSKEVGYDSSSRRYKKDIEDLEVDTSVLHNFSPKSFKFIDHGEEAKTNYGFIAEELEELNPILVGYDGEGFPQGINWNTITMFSIGEVQKLRKELDGTVNVIQVMMENMQKLKDEMDLMKNEIINLKANSPQI